MFSLDSYNLICDYSSYTLFWTTQSWINHDTIYSVPLFLVDVSKYNGSIIENQGGGIRYALTGGDIFDGEIPLLLLHLTVTVTISPHFMTKSPIPLISLTESLSYWCISQSESSSSWPILLSGSVPHFTIRNPLHFIVRIPSPYFNQNPHSPNPFHCQNPLPLFQSESPLSQPISLSESPPLISMRIPLSQSISLSKSPLLSLSEYPPTLLISLSNLFSPSHPFHCQTPPLYSFHSQNVHPSNIFSQNPHPPPLFHCHNHHPPSIHNQNPQGTGILPGQNPYVIMSTGCPLGLGHW